MSFGIGVARMNFPTISFCKYVVILSAIVIIMYVELIALINTITRICEFYDDCFFFYKVRYYIYNCNSDHDAC
jgi:hypothetical protein